MRAGFIFLVFFGMLLACQTNDDCVKTGDSTVGIRMYDSDSLELSSRVFQSIESEGLDSILVNFDTLSFIELPLRIDLDSVTFVMFSKLENDTVYVADTMVFSYKRTPKLISAECGIDVKISDLKLSHTFDSASVIRSNVTIYSSDNVEVYF